MKPERPDSTVSLKGLDYLDVPALAKRDYKVSFFTYKEGQYNAKVSGDLHYKCIQANTIYLQVCLDCKTQINNLPC